MPEGAVRLLGFARRFSTVGFPATRALSRKYRLALEETRFELLPAAVRVAPRLLVDVGANAGDWSVGMAMLTDARRIIAFEPVAAVFEELQRRAAAHPVIQPVRMALGARNGQIAMHVEARSQFSSTRSMHSGVRNDQVLEAPVRSEVVPLSTLDTQLANEPEIAILKIDVQGAQSEVLEGARETLQRTRVLLIEVMYRSYYEAEATFTELHAQIIQTSPLKLWGISSPAFGSTGRPEWADAVYVSPALVD